jgi:hypothetical protein
MQMMWSDVVLQVERLHLLRLLLWAGSSTVVGTGLLVLSLWRGRGSELLRRFALVCALFGAIELIASVLAYWRLGLRDLAGATRLERLAWLQLGLYLGVAAVGVTMSTVGRSVAPRSVGSTDAALPAIGGGIAVALHGLALATLELLLLAAISR